MEGHVGSRRSFDVVKNTTVTFLVKYCKEIFQKIINVSKSLYVSVFWSRVRVPFFIKKPLLGLSIY